MTKLEHALALAAEGFYVFPLLPDRKVPPKGMHFKTEATRDPAKITAWWTENPDCNIGIFTGKFGDAGALLVVDIDNKGTKHGDLDIMRLEIEGFDFPATREAHTPSGGRHLFYSVDHAVRQSAAKLGEGLDTRSRGGYVVGSGSTIGGKAYRFNNDLPVAPAPAWLVDRFSGPDRGPDQRPAELPVPVDHGRARDRAVAFLTNAEPAREGDAGDILTFKTAARLKDFGVTETEATDLMLEHWNDRCLPPWGPFELATKVKNAYAYGENPVGSASPEAHFDNVKLPTPAPEAPPPVGHPFEELNKEYAFVIAGGGAHILWETTDAENNPTLEHLSMSAFHDKHAASKIQVGKKTNPVTREWMEWKGRRGFDGLVFMPRQKAPPRFYNLWRGFAVEPWPEGQQPTAEAEASLAAWIDHARNNVCLGNPQLFDWLIGYFAHLIQRPWEKPLVALVFKGEKGVGKNALVERVGALLGSHAMTTADRRYLIGNFNGHLENMLLFVLDEAFWSGDKQAEGIVKNLITGANHVIEHKGKEQFKVANRTRVVIIGNEDWLVPATHDERRFAVFDVGTGRKQDTNFFEQMRVGMERGGYRLLLSYLSRPEALGTINPNVAPSTAGLLEQKHASLDPFPQWWLACLDAGHLVASDFEEGWAEVVACERLRAAFQRWAKERQVKGWLPDDKKIGRLMRRMVPSHRHVRNRKDGYCYEFPGLDVCRSSWDAFIGHKVEWDA